MSATEFKFGDRVVHTGRPEWGTGVVTAVQPVVHEGKSVQQVTLRFDREGLKTLSTAFAPLEHAHEATPLAKDAAAEPKGWLDSISTDDPSEAMARLPEPTRDPFTSIPARLKATLTLYRFTDRGASLLDWAAAQTGLADPLSRFNRHQLEVFFKRFANERDAHLRKLVGEGRKQDPQGVEMVMATAPSAAKDALRRVYADR